MRLRETAIVSGGLLAQQVTVFATGVLIARYLGSAGYGALGTLKSLSSLLLIVTPLGLDLALLKHASFYHERLGELRTISRMLRLVVTGLNVLLLGFVFLWFGPVLQGIYREIPGFAGLCTITALGLIFAADIQISGALCRVFDRIVPYALIVSYAQSMLRMAVSFVVLLVGGGVESLTWVNAAIFAMVSASLGFLGGQDRTRPLSMPAREVARKVGTILAESLWMAVALVVYQAIRLVDILILAALTTPAITGEYTAISSVSQLIQIYPIAISQTLGPRIALLYRQEDRPGIVAELRGYLRKASMLGGYLFGGVAVFGTDLDLVFGHGFEFPWLLPVLLASGWYISATLAPFGYVLSMTGRHREEVAILSAGAVLLVACLLVLIPPLGAIGAASSVTIAFVAVNTARCAYVIRILSLSPLRVTDMLPPLCFLAVALVCWEVGAQLGERGLALLIAECLAYSTLAIVVYLLLLASSAEWIAVRQGLARRIWAS